MTTDIDIHKFARQNVLKMIDGLTLDQINKIPDGFTGNIAWHIGHIITTQQGLIYSLSRNAVSLEKEFMDKYKKGTKPAAPIDQAELDFIKSQLVAQPEKLILDSANNIFQNYTVFRTAFGNEITCFQDAVSFNNVHEGMHIGYIMSMKHCL